MVKHRFISFILAAALLVSLAGCTGRTGESSSASAPEPDQSATQEETPNVIPFTLAFYPDYSLHPLLAENRANLVLAPLLYEGLFSVDERFQAAPELCESYQVSGDGLVWTFLLKQGVTFSDGTHLTGDLAAQALRTALAPGSRYAGRVAELRSVSGDETTVTIRLTAPNAALPALLDIPITLDNSQRPLGTGPYVLSETGDAAFLTARRDWHGGTGLPFDTIRLFQIRQADDLIAAFGSGEVTLLDADLTATNALGYSGSYEVWDYSTTDFLFLGFRCDGGFCRDVKVRQAIARAVDREAVVTVSYAGHATAAALPVHPHSPLYSEWQASQAYYAPQELAELLSTLKLPSQPLTLLVNSENNAKVSAAQSIAEQLQAAGLPVTVDKRAWSEYLAALNARDFDLYLGEVLLTAGFELSALLSYSGALNYGGFSDEQTARRLSDFRQGETRPLYELLRETAPLVPICFKNGSVLTQWGRLSGLSPRQNHIFNALENWTLDPDRTAGTNDTMEESK